MDALQHLRTERAIWRSRHDYAYICSSACVDSKVEYLLQSPDLCGNELSGIILAQCFNLLSDRKMIYFPTVSRGIATSSGQRNGSIEHERDDRKSTLRRKQQSLHRMLVNTL